MIKRFTFGIVVALLLCASSPAAFAQDDGVGWTLAGVQDARELFASIEDFANAKLSPDGTMVAVPQGAEQLCMYSIADNAFDCAAWPEQASLAHYVTWSPDGAYLAFAPEFFQRFNEPDLWVYDVAAGSFTNLTDDGVEGNMLRAEGALIDYLPMWHPTDGDIYFFRTQDMGGNQTLELYRISPAGGEPELVQDLTGELPTFSVYEQAAISPDGGQLAMIVLNGQLDDPINGVWLLSLGGELRQVLTLGDLRANIPDWQEESLLTPQSLAWTADSSGLVVVGRDAVRMNGVAMNAVYIDAATGEVTPLVDYSDVPDEQSWVVAAEGEAHSGSYRMPRMSALSPDGKAFVYLHYDMGRSETIDISALPLPPDGSEPVYLGSVGIAVGPIGMWDRCLVTAAENGRALTPIYHFLLTLEEK
jgi:hypothetical protein